MFPKSLLREALEVSFKIMAICWLLELSWALVQPTLPLLIIAAAIVGLTRLRTR
jgi:hypothetical protein